jgi:proteasome lid subunit RPN8/RPN11
MNDLSGGLRLTPEQWAQMQADVSLRNSEEACGLVAGQGNRANLVIAVSNILHDAHRFRMDPQEELRAFQIIEEQGLEVLAIYHSHPYGIHRPSATDLAELTFPGVIYLIWYQHIDTWHCRGYLMNTGGSAIEVPVIISTNR